MDVEANDLMLANMNTGQGDSQVYQALRHIGV